MIKLQWRYWFTAMWISSAAATHCMEMTKQAANLKTDSLRIYEVFVICKKITDSDMSFPLCSSFANYIPCWEPEFKECLTQQKAPVTLLFDVFANHGLSITKTPSSIISEFYECTGHPRLQVDDQSEMRLMHYFVWLGFSGQLLTIKELWLPWQNGGWWVFPPSSSLTSSTKVAFFPEHELFLSVCHIYSHHFPNSDLTVSLARASPSPSATQRLQCTSSIISR